MSQPSPVIELSGTVGAVKWAMPDALVAGVSSNGVRSSRAEHASNTLPLLALASPLRPPHPVLPDCPPAHTTTADALPAAPVSAPS